MNQLYSTARSHRTLSISKYNTSSCYSSSSYPSAKRAQVWGVLKRRQTIAGAKKKEKRQSGVKIFWNMGNVITVQVVNLLIV
jgi:hypothetical protein